MKETTSSEDYRERLCQLGEDVFNDVVTVLEDVYGGVFDISNYTLNFLRMNLLYGNNARFKKEKYVKFFELREFLSNIICRTSTFDGREAFLAKATVVEERGKKRLEFLVYIIAPNATIQTETISFSKEIIEDIDFLISLYEAIDDIDYHSSYIDEKLKECYGKSLDFDVHINEDNVCTDIID